MLQALPGGQTWPLARCWAGLRAAPDPPDEGAVPVITAGTGWLWRRGQVQVFRQAWGPRRTGPGRGDGLQGGRARPARDSGVRREGRKGSLGARRRGRCGWWGQ